MRIAFVDNVLLEQTAAGYQVATQPHLGLISLIAVVRELGHDASLYDPKLDLVRGVTHLGTGFYRAAAERIVADRPDAVGFTALGCNFVCTAQIAAQVRTLRPDAAIILGGPHASIVDREILAAFPQFDAIVRNEAEATIGDVVAALGGDGTLATIPGITYRRGGEIARTDGAGPLLDLDGLPFPAYDAYPINELGLTTLHVDAGRGCPFGCTFCSTASFFGRRYRLKSAEHLVAQLDRLSATYGVRHFGLTHDLFTVDRRKVRAFCDVVASRGYTWDCSARMDCVDAALLAEMREAGCTAIYFGVETGSRRLQPLVGKHLDLDLYYPTVTTALDLGMQTTVSFITGYPNEIDADREETLALAGESIARYPDALSVQLHLLTPEPGTALHQTYSKTLAYDGHVSDFNFPPLVPGDADQMSAHPDVFVCHHYFDAGLPRSESIAVSEGYRALYGLGHALLAAAARAYGSFTALVRDFGAFTQAMGGDPYAALAAFADAHLGPEHAVAEIVRYRLAVTALRPDDAEPVAEVDSTTAIRLARSVVPLDRARDGAELLRRLRTGEDVDAPLPRTWRLLVSGDEQRAHGTFDVDPLTYELASALASPTTRRALEQRFDPAEVDARLWSLGMLGAIVRHRPTTDRLAPPVVARR